MTTSTHNPPLRKGDWIRFQLKTNRMVLEGFIQEVVERKIRVGHAPAPPQNDWFSLDEIILLHHQAR